MVLSPGATAPARPVPPSRWPVDRSRRWPIAWLAAVAAGYTLTMLVVVMPRSLLSWDETVYASQVNPRAPALYFSAPRARGITYLIAPVVWFTDSTPVLRTYLAVVAGVLLVVAYWPWLRVFRRPALVPVAALLFAGLWVVLFYGAAAMPNVWVAFGAVALVGWFVRYGYDGQRRALVGLGAALAWTALLRPSDAFWVILPLVVAMLALRRWRRPALFLAVVAGAGVGVAPWLVESFQRFGGPVARLHRASEIEGGLGWHPEGALYQLRAVTGPTLCRPCHATLSGVLDPPLVVFRLWLLALPLLVAAGLLVAARRRRLLPLAVPAAAGASIGLSYLLLVGYAAPRFLITTYALLALPVGAFLTWLAAAVPGRFRRPAVAGIGLLVAVQVASQVFLLAHRVDRPTGASRDEHAAAALSTTGIRPPCLILGRDSAPIAYRMHCTTASANGHNKNTTPAGLVTLTHRYRTAYVTARATPPARYAGWHRHRLPPGPGVRAWYAYTPPWQ